MIQVKNESEPSKEERKDCGNYLDKMTFLKRKKRLDLLHVTLACGQCYFFNIVQQKTFFLEICNVHTHAPGGSERHGTPPSLYSYKPVR